MTLEHEVKTKDLYDLEMMEAQDIGEFEVTRVPGGLSRNLMASRTSWAPRCGRWAKS